MSPTPPSAPATSGGFAFGGGALSTSVPDPFRETNVTYTRNVARTHAADATSRGGAIFFLGDDAGQPLTNATLTANTAGGGVSNRGGDIFVRTTASRSRTQSSPPAQPTPGPRTAGRGRTGVSRQQHRQPRSVQLPRRRRCRQHGSAAWVTCRTTADPSRRLRWNQAAQRSTPLGAAACPATDARGVLRPAGGACDVGAFEIATASATTAPAASVTTGSAVLNGIASNPDLAPEQRSFSTARRLDTAAAPSPTDQPGDRDAVTSQRTAGGLSPGTTYHFRLVTRNPNRHRHRRRPDVYDGSQGPDPRRAATRHIAVRSVSVAGATAIVRVACKGPRANDVRAPCWDGPERLRGRSIVSRQRAPRHSASRRRR